MRTKAINRTTHRVYVGDVIEGEVQPSQLQRFSQEMGDDGVESAQIRDDVVIETQGTTHILIFTVSFQRPLPLAGILSQGI